MYRGCMETRERGEMYHGCAANPGEHIRGVMKSPGRCIMGVRRTRESISEGYGESGEVYCGCAVNQGGHIRGVWGARRGVSWVREEVHQGCADNPGTGYHRGGLTHGT